MKNISSFDKNFSRMLGLYILLGTSCYGLFYNFAVFFAGILAVGLLLWIFKSNKTLHFTWNPISIALIFMTAFSLLTCFYGIDKGMSIVGFLRMLVILIIMLLCMQMNAQHRQNLRSYVVYTGIFMTVVCLIMFLIPDLKDYVWQAKRLGGFFQYSNTCALFLLIGVIFEGERAPNYDTAREISGNKNTTNYDVNKKEILFSCIRLLILSLGIMLTGSRTVYILYVATIIFIIIKRRTLRVPLIAIALSLVVIGGIYAVVSGNFQNIGRYLTISTGSSTFLGRLLYWKDGIGMVTEHPFGTGYMGYSYLQTSLQTGVYATRFVHNDFLQIMLDTGIIPGILFIYAFVREIFTKKTETFRKWSLLIMGIHFFMDFDMQYPIMIFLLLPEFSWDNGKQTHKKSFKAFTVVTGLLSAVFLYFGIANFASYMDWDDTSLAMYPYDTGILIEKLNHSDGMNIADVKQLADDILAQNEYVSVAYDAKALLAAMENDYDATIEYKELAITNNKYALFEYVDYLNLLKRSLTYYEQTGNTEKYQENISLMKSIPLRLEKVLQDTDSLGFKINDKPELTLSDEILEYLDSL